MKKLFILLTLFISIIGIKAQSTIVTFTGEDTDGNYARLDSVIIIDVTRSWAKTIYFPDTTIDLFYVGIPSHRSESEQMILYQNTPNPCNGNTTFNLYLPEKDNITIEISDILGRKVQSFQQTLEKGTHSFTITLNSPQVYFLTAKTSSGTSSIKIINTNENQQAISISYSNSISNSAKIEKSATQEFFLRGDSMMYIGYNKHDMMTISQKQNNNETIRFTFGSFVDKTPLNRNVLIEEFTGVNCTYCPLGHRISDSLADLYEGHCFPINIHAGPYASTVPNFMTEEGNELLSSFFDATGYPAGMVGRLYWTVNSDQNFCLHPNYFPYLVPEVMKMSAYVNVAAKTTIDTLTRELSCTVQAYFTNSPTTESTENIIYIALIQNNIKGPQSGGSIRYPEMWDGTKYTHNHMLRAYINSISGTTIPTNTQGTLFNQTFSYSIPMTLGLGNIPVDLNNLEILVFITEKVESNGKTYGLPVINVNKSSIILK